jgi:Na+-transporting NADH:ubiquinone oxidoreductase subunit A
MIMPEIVKIRKGLDIRMLGKADKIYLRAERSSQYAIKPSDFHGVMPKLLVKPGDRVNVGTALFFDKYNPEVKFTSPVSGVVSAINRGERRVIQEVVIDADAEDSFVSFTTADPSGLDRQQITGLLLEAGLWPLLRQRPYSVIPRPGSEPKAIFISGFDSAPLAPDLDFMVKDHKDDFQNGIDALKKLCSGKIHLSVDARFPVTKTFSEAKGVEIHHFKGPHPAGNVGIQIHHIDPINKGETVWYIRPQDVISIGRFFRDGRVDNTCIVSLTGSEVKKPVYYKLIRCAGVSSLLENINSQQDVRIISGNVLTGTQVSRHGFLGFYDHQVTVIPEGRYFEFLGWAMPRFGKFSTSRTYFSWLMPSREYKVDTNLNGGHRAFVMTGEYEKVLPMKIHPLHLLKAILVDDIEKMEQLGIYEVSEEEFALCEFVCTSKADLQQIIRQGLDTIRRETE